jgi:bifunctional non-homologous end joining protein LigD
VEPGASVGFDRLRAVAGGAVIHSVHRVIPRFSLRVVGDDRHAEAVAEGLREYRRKRDPVRTPEPFGSRGRGDQPIFVVQRHQARRLHYDFRLEREGALASWAVPKGVPLEPGAQHLAVHVEDHPLDYADFEGEIPKGEYGAGTVEIWDRGTYELLEEKKDGGLTVRLHGARLDGTWALVPAKLSGDPKNWLLLRKREGHHPQRAVYVPMLATLVDDVPTGSGWLFEVKWDGYRALAYVRGGEVTLVSRRGNDLTERFESVAKAIGRATRSPECVLDGEVCALDAQGRSSFSAMQQDEPGTPLVYYVFDVLEIDGKPLLDLPLTERRSRLQSLLEPGHATVRLSEAFDDGEALLDAAEAQGLEGVIAKRGDSRYAAGRRTRDWLKVKTHGRQEFVIAGYTRGKGRRAASFGSLVLATHADGDLAYVGNVGTGFSEAEIEKLLRELRPLERATPPFSEVPKMPRVRKGDVVWVAPKLIAEVEFAQWTHDGHLRAPSYLGLREDKPPEEVRPEVSLSSEDGHRAPIGNEVRARGRTVKLSNLDKVFWPEEGITKGDLLAYYRAVAPALVPHLRDRPFTMKRYPDGWRGEHFFQKDAPKHMPEWIKTVPYHATTRETTRRKRWINVPLVNDELALLWMVNMGCIDLNVWYSRIDKPERPDFVLFDLDPSPDVGFPETIEVALLLRGVLDALELVSFPKTSGSRGIHILAPIARRHTYDETREFAEIVAGALARSHRGLVTTEWSKAKRRGVLIDANQNGEGKTIASVYSVRPRDGAPVSTPLRWDEVTPELDPLAFTMDTVLARVERHGDLYGGVLTEKQSLTDALRNVR